MDFVSLEFENPDQEVIRLRHHLLNIRVLEVFEVLCGLDAAVEVLAVSQELQIAT